MHPRCCQVLTRCKQMEFEKENDIMDQRQEMMDDAIDDVTGLEDEEEGEEVVKEILDEIGIDLGQAVRVSDYLTRQNVGFCRRLHTVHSLARPQVEYRKLPSRKGLLQRLLGVVTLEMTTFRRG